MDEDFLHIAYHLKQSVRLMYRETETSSPLKEDYERVGLLLLRETVKGEEWHRELTEFITGEPYLKEIRERKASISLGVLKARHSEAMKSRKIEFGLRLPIDLASDMKNRDVAFSGLPAAGLPYHLLYLPTVLPARPAKKPDAGERWMGNVRLRAGAGVFAVSYSVTLKERIGQDPKVLVQLEESPLLSSLRNIDLTMNPSGAFTIQISSQDGAPVSTAGSFQVLVHASVDKSGERVEVDVLDCRVEYELERIPLQFNRDSILPASWPLPKSD